MKNKIKTVLKKSKTISKINATMKCKALKKQYQAIVDKYNNIEQQCSLEELMLQKGFTKEWKDSLRGKKLNVFFYGKDEFQDRSGFIQDLGKVCELKYFVKENGEYGRFDEDLYYSGLSGKDLNTDKLIEYIEKLIASNNKPDFVIFQALGKTFNVNELYSFKLKHNLKFINICLDDRLVFQTKTYCNNYDNGAIGLKSIVDLALVSNPEVVEWYLKENIPAIFFPMASSSDFYYPLDIEKRYDVGFIGNKYGYREELVTRLIEAGINVEARGTGWKAGRIKLEDNNNFFNECKIVLGIGTVGHCKDFYTQKLRDFDAPLSGAVYVTHNNKDLKTLFIEDEEIILCDTIDDYITKIKYLLNDKDKMQFVSNNALKKASKEHTYKKRFLDLFTFLGAI